MMKIDSTGKPVASRPVGGKSRVGARTSVASSSAPSDSVDINPLASQMAAAEQEIRQQPAFDAEKVAAIKDAIAAGKFQINPEAIADSLIAVTRELLQDKP
ncbi:flagellar biosynthesis anti-sigma factor FlgM [Aquaspirillum sp. LM1]|jgi:negative regulator of flagellin synthesis FlgM|uniref:flagellar biosynthesis anti-sigma factor FlgM n=1 Tax=Aquaspirillum sp. LM1 TaxID=1938604 RepID=UPI00209AF2DC|nr:flagellar biosynthesis anti-sigma factor FlgM [Aquaspirillum sp. LM1]